MTLVLTLSDNSQITSNLNLNNEIQMHARQEMLKF